MSKGRAPVLAGDRRREKPWGMGAASSVGGGERGTLLGEASAL